MTEPSQAIATPSQPSEDEAARKEAMQKAGADYFDKVLKKAQAGKDPFREPPRPRRKITDAEEVDPDLETVGRVLEGSKLYVINALFIISSSCSLVLAKGAMMGLRTPCIQAFLHMLPTLGLLWAFVDVAPLTAGLAQGVLPSAAVSAVQAVSLFSALLYADMKMVISWVILCPALLQTALQLHQGRRAQTTQLVLIGVGVLGLLLGSLLGERPGILGMLSLLGWTAGQAGSLAWSVVRSDRHMAASLLGESRVEVAMRTAQEEGRIGAGSLDFYRTALPAGPILVLGFMCLEGKEVVHHELSVPDVTQLLLSVACWATACATGALLADLPSTASRANLEPCWGVGALIAIAVVERTKAGWGMLAAALAIGSGVGMQLLHLYENQQRSVPSVV